MRKSHALFPIPDGLYRAYHQRLMKTQIRGIIRFRSTPLWRVKYIGGINSFCSLWVWRDRSLGAVLSGAGTGDDGDVSRWTRHAREVVCVRACGMLWQDASSFRYSGASHSVPGPGNGRCVISCGVASVDVFSDGAHDASHVSVTTRKLRRDDSPQRRTIARTKRGT